MDLKTAAETQSAYIEDTSQQQTMPTHATI